LIRRTPKGWVVYSRTGKRLSRPYKTKAAAHTRLGQIEHFKKKAGAA
jgi:hypothetical protein